ncbi:MAG: hypothetical protein EON58_15460 [Alphaproteobacteria bacterium]|nr:MAG: hypothetical protein EON58_15460 [Alphaproteobacteria bacterium]
MRQFSSSREAWQCRLAACGLILVVSVATVFFILHAFLPVMMMSDAVTWWMIVAAFLLLAFLTVVCLVLTNRFCCPMCLAKPLAIRTSDYRRLGGFLVQRKLMTSWFILRSSCFFCPYCGDSLSVRGYND